MKKGLKAARFYFAPEKLQITPAKEQERRKRKSEKMESRRREKKNGCTLSFCNGYFGDSCFFLTKEGLRLPNMALRSPNRGI